MPISKVIIGGRIAALILAVVFAAAAQTTESCRADVQHLKLPERAFIDDVLGLDQPPLVLLFSRDGVDAYSATHFKVMRLMKRSGMQVANAFTIILVYQDERIRQQKIESLQKSYPLAKLENLKFATWRFELTPIWVDNVLMRKWLVTGMAYFVPVSCTPLESRMPASAEGYLQASINGNNYLHIIGTGMPPLIIPEAERLPAAPNSVLDTAVEAMRHELQSYGFPD